MFGMNLFSEKDESKTTDSEVEDEVEELEWVEEEGPSGSRREVLKTAAGAAATVGAGGAAMAMGSEPASAHTDGSSTYQCYKFVGANAKDLGERVTFPDGGFCPNFVNNGDEYSVAFWYAADQSNSSVEYEVDRKTDVYWNDCCLSMPDGAVPLGGFTQGDNSYCTTYFLNPV